jgi:uncharacterized protein
MSAIEYDWDPAKQRANRRKHGLDFEDAWRVYEHPRKVTVPDEYPDEERWNDLAEVNGIVHFIVYVEDGDIVRLISYRKASPAESRFYYEESTRR